MATVQKSRVKQKSQKALIQLPNKISSEQESLLVIKRLLAISVSSITYLRGLFPESSYGTRYLEELCLKILREDKSCPGSLQIVKWIQGSFDALEKKYLRMAVLMFYTEPCDPEVADLKLIIQDRKRSKFQRDAQDYSLGEVYQWRTDNIGGQRRGTSGWSHRRNRRPKKNVDTSESTTGSLAGDSEPDTLSGEGGSDTGRNTTSAAGAAKQETRSRRNQKKN